MMQLLIHVYFYTEESKQSLAATSVVLYMQVHHNKLKVLSKSIIHQIIYRLKFFYLPTDAQEICFKKNIKIYIKTTPTCFGLITIIRERII